MKPTFPACRPLHGRRPWGLAGLIVVALLAGCASAPPPTPPTRAPAPVQSPAPVVSSAASATEVKPQPVPQDNGDAIGTATDPMASDRPVDLQASEVRDLWERVRMGFGMPDLLNDNVRLKEQFYAGQPDYFERMSTRGSRYLYHIVEELEERKMPTELALLPFIESAFNPTAISSAKAQGMWQFMPATGRHFNLKQNLFRDERRDVLESTRAALDYLNRLYGMFGDWHLALAAYNWGEGNVQRALNRNRAQGLPTDYDSLNMPIETRHYVPKLQAVKNIVARPEQYGIRLIDLPNHPYFVSVPIQRDIDVDLAARLAEITVEDFRQLNPSQKKPVILASAQPRVLLPYDNAERFQSNLSRYHGPLARWTAWVVPRTMKTRDAAAHVGMSEEGLRQANAIPPKMLVRAGSTLLVERRAGQTQNVAEHVADNASLGLAPDLPPLRRVQVSAGRNDSVSSLARRYRVQAAQVAQWNRIGVQTRLRRGQALVLWLPQGARATRLANAPAARQAPTLVSTPALSRDKRAAPPRAAATAQARRSVAVPRAGATKRSPARPAASTRNTRKPAATVPARGGRKVVAHMTQARS